jgi:hypothetical protein
MCLPRPSNPGSFLKTSDSCSARFQNRRDLIEWNAHCRDFVAMSCPAGRTYLRLPRPSTEPSTGLETRPTGKIAALLHLERPLSRPAGRTYFAGPTWETASQSGMRFSTRDGSRLGEPTGFTHANRLLVVTYGLTCSVRQSFGPAIALKTNRHQQKLNLTRRDSS